MLDRDIWNEFSGNWENLPYQSEKLIADMNKTPIEKTIHLNEEDLPKAGIEREQIVKARVNQRFFRLCILASYNFTCCITGLQKPELLIASHVRPWALDDKNRMNPSNGIALNALHDKAFENGLLTITPEYKIKISSALLKQSSEPAINDYFSRYHGQNIILPSRFLPDTDFLRYHNEERFID